MNWRLVQRLLVAVLLASAIVLAGVVSVTRPAAQVAMSSEPLSPWSMQQTTIARPTLNPTRMPLTAQPVATIQAGLTATAQTATLVPTPTATAPPTPTSRVRPTPGQVPRAGQAGADVDLLAALWLALACMLAGGLLVRASRYD